MKETDLKEAFPKAQSEGWFSCPSRESLLESLGLQVLESCSEGSYSGVTLLFVLDPQGPRLGFLSYYYGSCSGCDSVQGANSYDDAADIRNALRDSIEWAPSVEEFVIWIRSPEWEEAHGCDDPQREFRDKVSGILLSRCFVHEDCASDETLARACYARTQESLGERSQS